VPAPNTPIDISGIDVVAKRFAGKKIYNAEYRKPTLLGLMRGFDNFYNQESNLRFTKLDTQGGAMAFTFWAGLPVWEGVDPLNPDYTQRRVNLVKNTKLKQGVILPSAAQLGEPIDKYEVSRFKSETELANYAMQVGDRAAEGFNNLYDSWLWPGTNAVGGSGFATGDKTRVMQWDYALQNGFAGNDPAGAANPFSYLGIDMHAFPEAKAINVGTDAVPWVLSEEALELSILMPLRDRGANIDMVLCGQKAFARLRQLLQARILTAPTNTMKYGGPYFQLDNGTFVVYESGIDRAPKECMYVGDSSTIRFGMDPDGVTNMNLIKDWPEMPSAYLLQGYAETCWVNEHPRYWARVYNLAVS
jgi:hypothetical protein